MSADALRFDDGLLREQDAAARRVAQTIFARPIVLEAGAGTGKTSALVARIVAWTMGGGWRKSAEALAAAGVPPTPEAIAVRTLNRVVAITFTEAAASEMAERVGQALVRVEAGDVPEGLLEEVLPDDLEVRRRRSAALLSALDHLLVRTIHAYCRRLLSRYPLEAGLHPAFDIDADESRLENLVRAVVLERTREALSEPIDEDFRKLFAQGYQPQVLFSTLKHLAVEATPASVLARDPLSGPPVRALAQRLEDRCRALSAVVGSRLASARRSPTSRDVITMTRRLMKRLKALREGEGPLYLTAILQWVEDLFNETMLNRLTEWRRGRLNSTEHARLSKIQEPLALAADGLLASLKHVLRLEPERLDLSRRVLHPMLREVRRRMRAAGVETFSALLSDARELLRRTPAVRATVQASIDQLLVDEFQDTDALQCDVIRWLALEGDARPGLFIVGDPKQSIYGWRDADLRAYDAFVQEVVDAGGQRWSLSLNFRSVPRILDEVSAVISPVMSAEEGLQPPFQPLIPFRVEDSGFETTHNATVEYWNSLAWQHDLFDPDTRSDDATEVEAAALAADIRRLHDEEGVKWSEVGLLMRSSGDLDRYLRHLRDAHVPYTVERDRSYYQRREIIDAAAMVRTIIDPHDHLALIGFLRSSACGLPDAALLPLWSRGFPGMMTRLTHPDDTAMAEILRVITAVGVLLKTQQQQLPGVEHLVDWTDSVMLGIEGIAQARDDLLRMPSDVFVERLRMRMLFEVMESARYQGVYRVANLDRFFRRLQQALEDGGDIEGVLRALRRSVAEVAEDEEGRPKEAVEDAVSVMTIHKSKGLDFNHVYVLQMHRTGDDGRLPFTAIERRGGMGQEYVLLGTPSLGWDEVDRYQRAVAAAERVRLLYVAMTRARDRVVLCGKWRPDGEGRTPRDARSLIDLVGNRVGGLPEAESLAADARQHDDDRVRQDQTLWVFPGRRPHRGAMAPVNPDERNAPSLDRVQATAHKLAAARQRAREEEKRLRGGAAWAHPDAQPFEELAWNLPGVSMRNTIDQAVGTAIHGALAELDLDEDSGPERTRLSAWMIDALRPILRAEEVQPAIQLAQDRLREIFDLGWPGRIAALRPHLKARALPVLMPPPDMPGAPIGFLSGELDLVYVDPEDGQVVIVDFKTDRLRDPAELDARIAAYRGQGEGYRSALQQALNLPASPRWEIWFLLEDHIASV
ncbi:MAG: UvrD-helicase domain-containing protein [Myxococcota bacterium]